MSIFLIGDSHCFTYENIPEINIQHWGALTAYNLHKKDKLLLLKYFSPRFDKLIFHFGSIDARIHIYYQYMKRWDFNKISILRLIDKTIENYLNVLKTIHTTFNKIGVHGIVPEREENIYNYEHYAEDSIRAKICWDFNFELKHNCKKLNIPYFDLYTIPGVIDTDYLINPLITSDGVHIDPNKYPQIYKYFLDWCIDV